MPRARLPLAPSLTTISGLLALCGVIAGACGDSNGAGGPPGPDSGSDASMGRGGSSGGGGGSAGASGGSAGASGSGAGGDSGPIDAGRCSLLGSGPIVINWGARPGDDAVTDVATAPGGQVYALHIDDNQEAHLTRLDASGRIEWKKSFFGQDVDSGRGYVNPQGLAADSLGRAVVVGTFQRTVSFAGELRSAAFAGTRTPQAIFVMRFNEDGTTSYLKTFDGVDLQAIGVAIDSSHRAWITGNVIGTVNLGGLDLTSRGDDGFLLQLDADGSHLFSRTVGSSGRDGVVSIAIGPQGGPVIAGFMRGPSDLLAADAGARSGIYVASFDSSGALAW
jgi:hypothetical protein